MEQEDFFRAIAIQDKEVVGELLEKDVEVNALSPCGTALYRTVKLNNFEICQLLMENKADCNIVQLDFDQKEKHPHDDLLHLCFIYTPIDFLCNDYDANDDVILQYLLENRPMVNENMIEKRILYCLQLFDESDSKRLFDYATSYFLRTNMYDYLLYVGKNSSLTLVLASLNVNGYLPRETTSLTDGAGHEAFFTLIIRSLFEELVRFRLDKSTHITSDEQYDFFLRELVHNLEAYNLFTDVRRTPYQKKDMLYPRIAKNIIQKLRAMKTKDEYTLPIKWGLHAVCVTLVREPNSIAIRVDNLNFSGEEKNKHRTYGNEENGFMIPKLIGEIPIEKLDDNQDYFISLLRCIKEETSEAEGIKIVYHNTHLKHLNETIDTLAGYSEEKLKTLKYFIPQVAGNCFIKCHEPGLAIRFNDYDIYQEMLTILRVYATKLTTKDILNNRNELEQAFEGYWGKELTIKTIAAQFEEIRLEYQNYRIQRMMNQTEDFPIAESYINLALVQTKIQNETEKKLRDASMDTYEEIYGTKTTVDVKDMFETCKGKIKKMLVLGRAGIGKSTFCRYVACRWAKGEIWSHYTMVVLIPLRSLTKERYPLRQFSAAYTLIDLLQREYFACYRLSQTYQKRFTEQCDKGQVLWLLDGYDEFGQNIPEQLKVVFEYIRKSQHHILTSRPYMVSLPYDTKMEITGFTDENIISYVKKFFNQTNNEHTNASLDPNNLLTFLKLNPSIWGVSHIPVNLELICSIWNDSNSLPTNIITTTALYDHITKYSCRQYLIKQNIVNEKMYIKDPCRQCQTELAFLESLAFHGMEKNCLLLGPELIKEAVKDTKVSADDHPQIFNIGILKSCQLNSTQSPNPAEQQHYFVHLSFQEHFTARYIVNILNSTNRQKAIDFIKDHKYNQRFLLVFTFISGLLAERDDQAALNIFWNTILGDPLDLVGIRHLQLVITCMEEAGNKSFARRIESIDYITRCIKYIIAEHQYPDMTFLNKVFRRASFVLNQPEVQNIFVNALREQNETIITNLQWVLANQKDWKPSPQLLQALLDVLNHGTRGNKTSVCQILGKIGEKVACDEVIRALLNALDSGYDSLKAYACIALGNMGEKAASDEVIKALVTVIGGKDEWIWETASEALAQIGPKAPNKELIKALVLTKLVDQNTSVRVHACHALGHMDEKVPSNEVIKALIIALGDEHPRMRAKACDALGHMGEKVATDEVIKALITTLGDEAAWVRRLACSALVQMDTKVASNEVIKALAVSCVDQNQEARESACAVLREMCEKTTSYHVIRALLTALGDQVAIVRKIACDALGWIAKSAASSEARKLLVSATDDQDRAIGNAARVVFLQLGQKTTSNEVSMRLLTALDDQDWLVRYGACVTLGQIGQNITSNEVIKALVTKLGDQELAVREVACVMLGQMGQTIASNEVIEVLVTTVGDQEWMVGEAACVALGQMGEQAMSENVIAALSKVAGSHAANWALRKAAIVVLGQMGDKAATFTLTNYVLPDIVGNPSDNWALIEAACVALGQMGEKAADEQVIFMLGYPVVNHRSRKVRAAAEEALGRIGDMTPSHVLTRILLRLLSDSWDKKRIAASVMIANMNNPPRNDEIINALFESRCLKTAALLRIISSSPSLSHFSGDTVSKLTTVLSGRERAAFETDLMTKFFTAYEKTQIEEWTSLIVEYTVRTGLAVVFSQDSIMMYDKDKPLKVSIRNKKQRINLQSAFANSKKTVGFRPNANHWTWAWFTSSSISSLFNWG